MTTSIQLFMIYMTSKLPQTSARHPQIDQDTHRHHPDTPQTKAFLGIRDHWKKQLYLSWQDFFTFLQTDLLSIPPQTHSDSIQTPSDTIQTPPGISVFYAIHGTWIKDNIRVSWPNIICLPTKGPGTLNGVVKLWMSCVFLVLPGLQMNSKANHNPHAN